MAEQQPGSEPQPQVDRPELPAGYGIPATSAGALPWSHASALLAEARNSWVGTTRPDGRPHAMPTWGAWLDGVFYFGGSPETRRGRNLKANPAVVVHIEKGDNVVILEGEAEEVANPDAALATRLVDAFATKYGYRTEPDSWAGGGLYAVRPRLAFAWNAFPKTATRSRFFGNGSGD